METAKFIFTKTIQKPAHKVIIKRGIKAAEYMAYCHEVGCDIWGLLLSIKSNSEPVCLWLPPAYIKPGTSQYVQGVEVPLDYCGPIPEGLDVIEFGDALYLQFQGEKFAEEDYVEAITQLKAAIDKFDPSTMGYRWDNDNPRIQLEPIGQRGYIELLPVKELD